MIQYQLVFLLTLASTVTAQDLKVRPDVATLNRSSYETILTTADRVLVAYYRRHSPGDEYLSLARPNFVSAAKTLAARGAAVQLAEVDIDADPDWDEFITFRKMSVGPFLRYYCHGQEAYSRWSQMQAWRYFSAKYDPVMLVDWLVSQPCPIFNEVDYESQLEELVNENQVVLLGLFDVLKEPDSTWTGVNGGVREFHSAVFRTLNESYGLVSVVSDSDALRTKYSPEGNETVLLFRTYEDGSRKILRLDGVLNSATIYTFIRRASAPLVIPLSDTSIMTGAAFSESIEYHVIIFYSKANNDSERILRSARHVSSRFSSVAFVSADVDTGGYTRPFYDLFGRGPLPLIRMVRLVNISRKHELPWTKQYLKFRPRDHDKALSDEGMEEFISSVLSEEVKPFRNVDEPLDEKRGQGVVKMLNGNNFDSVVMKRKTHVMVFVYIDGAPHNEECMRDFWQLARNHKNDRPKVVFAAVDLLKNDIDGVDKATISYFKKEHHFKEDLDPYFHIRWYKTPLLPRLEKFYTDFTEKWAKRFWNNIYDDTQKRVEL